MHVLQGVGSTFLGSGVLTSITLDASSLALAAASHGVSSFLGLGP